MIRNLKTLGLTLVAAIVLGAMSASAASAQTQGMLTTDGASVTLNITETGAAGSNAFTAGASKIECPGTTYVGHEVGSATKLVPNKAKEVTITPTYKNCQATTNKVVSPMTITMNGCDYVYHVGNTVAADTYATTADIVCPPGKVIDMEFFMDAKHTMKICDDTIPPNVGIEGPHLKSTPASDDIDITGTEIAKGSASGLLCGESGEVQIKFDIDLTAKGINATGQATGITITD